MRLRFLILTFSPRKKKSLENMATGRIDIRWTFLKTRLGRRGGGTNGLASSSSSSSSSSVRRCQAAAGNYTETAIFLTEQTCEKVGRRSWRVPPPTCVRVEGVRGGGRESRRGILAAVTLDTENLQPPNFLVRLLKQRETRRRHSHSDIDDQEKPLGVGR